MQPVQMYLEGRNIVKDKPYYDKRKLLPVDSVTLRALDFFMCPNTVASFGIERLSG